MGGGELSPELPDDDAGGDADVERVLGAVLRYLEASVTEGEQRLVDTVDFVAEDDGGGTLGGELLERQALVDLLDGVNLVAFGFQLGETVGGVLIVLPSDRVFGTQCRLVDVAMGRCGSDAAETDAVDTKSVAGAEDGADVVEAANIVEHHNQGQLVGSLELFDADASKIVHGAFLHRPLAVYRYYPILPSRLMLSSFCASTANSIGSFLSTSLA